MMTRKRDERRSRRRAGMRRDERKRKRKTQMTMRRDKEEGEGNEAKEEG